MHWALMKHLLPAMFKRRVDVFFPPERCGLTEAEINPGRPNGLCYTDQAR